MLSWSTIHLQCGRPSLGSLGWEDPLENGKATHSSTLAWRIPGHGVTYYTVHGVTRVGHDWATFTFTFWASPVAQMVKNPPCNMGDLCSIPGLGRSPGEGKGYPLQYSGLENSMDCIVHGVTKSQTWLSDLHFDSLHEHKGARIFLNYCFLLIYALEWDFRIIR